MTMRVTRRWVLWALAMTGGLAACVGSDVEDLQRFVGETKSKFKGQVVALPEGERYQYYEYHAKQMRDPFRFAPVNASLTQPGGASRPDAARMREELEKYPLDALQMSGILRKDGETWALIKAPDGTVHRVRRGNYIGQNFGRIDAITDGRVDIVEMVANGTGGWSKHKNALLLNRVAQP